ncbi:molybdenum cofactor guanylyltransferase [Halopenitus persicus]|uniref:Probable molybdenum cofactor guanylyltransferase n=1 Tax=Halopenitus persicus TaxID=1048396 RepID=A0A1H3KTP5_9EURY|nr:molybdenum cofactor guanylyltransferase [Halopenitus persicus]QHS17986.1 molybdenum cofactor guanylyltransferase [haloarchaeon 3A1-DGR]SDY55386.1 molybdenum cofactor guanylyltransferase [Halopenitus persicus]
MSDSSDAGTCTGVILAGGRSTRFGDRDKALAPLAGTPMIRRVANRLAGTDDPVDPGGQRASDGDPVVDDLVINCRADQRSAIADAMAGYPLAVTYAEDEEPDRGPMAGIRDGCRGATGEYAAVVACDMPFVDPTLIAYLLDRCRDHDAAVPRLDDQWYQTTQAVYRATPMAEACDRALAAGERKIVEPLFDLEYVVVDEPEIRRITTDRTFRNVNTREEHADAEAWIAGV